LFIDGQKILRPICSDQNESDPDASLGAFFVVLKSGAMNEFMGVE